MNNNPFQRKHIDQRHMEERVLWTYHVRYHFSCSSHAGNSFLNDFIHSIIQNCDFAACITWQTPMTEQGCSLPKFQGCSLPKYLCRKTTILYLCGSNYKKSEWLFKKTQATHPILPVFFKVQGKKLVALVNMWNIVVCPNANCFLVTKRISHALAGSVHR